MNNWKTAEEIKQIINRETDTFNPQFEEDEHVLFWRFDEINGNALAIILSEIPNPTHIHIRESRLPEPPMIEVGFRLKEVEI